MCSNCFDKEYASFPAYWDYEKFELLFAQKLGAKNGLKFIGENEAEAYGYGIYKCATCNTIWHLSAPDNAWRGFFLTRAHSQDALDRIQRNDRLKRGGCLAIIAILVLLVIAHFLHQS